MKRLLIGLAFAALTLPAVAAAGGWATAGVQPPPESLGPGDTWKAQITVLQHGNPETPLSGVEPTLTIKSGSTSKTFKAKPTDKAGVYVAEVVFPSTGKWHYEVHDGFGTYGGAQTHVFAPIEIGPAGSSDGFPTVSIVAVILAAVGMGFLLWLLSRRVRVRAPAPTH